MEDALDFLSAVPFLANAEGGRPRRGTLEEDLIAPRLLPLVLTLDLLLAALDDDVPLTARRSLRGGGGGGFGSGCCTQRRSPPTNQYVFFFASCPMGSKRYVEYSGLVINKE